MSTNCNCHGTGGISGNPVMGVLTRPRYSPGLILEDADLTAAVDYTRELNRLLFRSLFGCGVICGFQIGLRKDCGLEVLVSPGLGLDGCGDPLQLVQQASIQLGRKDGVLPAEPDGPPERVRDFWVIACAAEKNCQPRALVCDSDELDGSTQATRTRLAVEVSVSFEPPQCVCGCGKFDPRADSRTLALQAEELMQDHGRGGRALEDRRHYCGNDPHHCHEAHYTNADCPADCGCGTACSCGCCILLGWVHWYEPDNDGERPGWRVLQRGVRRFIRPCLIDDPIIESWDDEPVPEQPEQPDQPQQPQTPQNGQTPNNNQPIG